MQCNYLILVRFVVLDLDSGAYFLADISDSSFKKCTLKGQIVLLNKLLFLVWWGLVLCYDRLCKMAKVKPAQALKNSSLFFYF